MTASLRPLLSDAVAVAERRTLATDEGLLRGDERALLTERMVDRRRHELVTGRDCAHRAMAALGVPVRPVGRGPGRAPRWPDGLVGSITHTAGFVAAAVAPATVVRSVGIDAEPDGPLPDGVLGQIALAAEAAAVDGLRGEALPHPDRLLFCAKEATYKAWHPVAGVWLGFKDVHVHVDVDRGTFVVEVLIDGPLATLHGRFAAADGFVLAAVET